MKLRHRIARLEATSVALFPLMDAIDRPPQETRDQWLARRAGNPERTVVNSRGETRAVVGTAQA